MVMVYRHQFLALHSTTEVVEEEDHSHQTQEVLEVPVEEELEEVQVVVLPLVQLTLEVEEEADVEGHQPLEVQEALVRWLFHTQQEV